MIKRGVNNSKYVLKRTQESWRFLTSGNGVTLTGEIERGMGVGGWKDWLARDLGKQWGE